MFVSYFMLDVNGHILLNALYYDLVFYCSVNVRLLLICFLIFRSKFGTLTTETTFPKKPKGKLAKLDNKPKFVRSEEKEKKAVEVDLWTTSK